MNTLAVRLHQEAPRAGAPSLTASLAAQLDLPVPFEEVKSAFRPPTLRSVRCRWGERAPRIDVGSGLSRRAAAARSASSKSSSATTLP